MQTTAGLFALVGMSALQDSTVAAKLRGDPRQDQSVGVGQLPFIRIHYICFLKGLYRECRKSSSIQTLVQGQKAATIRRCMSSNQEVCKNTTRPHIALLTPTFCVGLESSSCRSPHLLPQLPVDHNSSVLEK